MMAGFRSAIGIAAIPWMGRSSVEVDFTDGPYFVAAVDQHSAGAVAHDQHTAGAVAHDQEPDC